MVLFNLSNSTMKNSFDLERYVEVRSGMVMRGTLWHGNPRFALARFGFFFLLHTPKEAS